MKLQNTLILLGVCTVLLGCGEAPPAYVENLVPFSGKVTFKGEPLPEATVVFISKTGESRETAAVTGPDGTYSLTSSAGIEGALPGDYDVIISKFAMPDGTVPPPDVPPMDVGAEEIIPPKYSSAGSITLSATISESGGTRDFDL